MINYQIINPQIIAENMMQNTALIKQFLSLYLQQIPKDFQHLKDAVANRNRTEIASKAHHIKPTMDYIGAIILKQNFQHIETAAKNQTDFEQIDRQIAAAEKECLSLLEEINEYLSTL